MRSERQPRLCPDSSKGSGSTWVCSGRSLGSRPQCWRPRSSLWGPVRVEKPFGPTSWQNLLTSPNTAQPKEWGSWNLRTHMFPGTTNARGMNLSSGIVVAIQCSSLAGQPWWGTLMGWWSSSMLTSQATWRKLRCGILASSSSSFYRILNICWVHTINQDLEVTKQTQLRRHPWTSWSWCTQILRMTGRDQDGVHKVFKKHNQLSVWEQRLGGDVNYQLTGLHLDASASQMKSILVQIWNPSTYWGSHLPLAVEDIFLIWPKVTVSQGVDSYRLFSVLSSAEKILLLNSDCFAPDLSKELENWGGFCFPFTLCHITKVVEL